MIYGIHSVLEALESGKILNKIYIRKGIDPQMLQKIKLLARPQMIPIQQVPIEKLNKLTTKAHQGCIALVAPVEYTDMEQLVPFLFEQGKDPFIVVLDGITDTRNFGAIARTAECAGVDAIIIPSYGSVSVTADAINASAGALLHIPVCRVPNISQAVSFLSLSGINLVIANEKAQTTFFESELTGPIALILGNEHEGVSPQVQKIATTQVAIPMKGRISSLNVSVAAGILIYEIIKQRLS